MKSHAKLSLCAILLLTALSLSLTTAGMAGNTAPVAENLEYETYRGVSFGGKLSAVDPDGDLITYQITTEPVKGDIALLSDGNFIYTPADGKRGKDYFGYKAMDAGGNVSQEATVIIKLLKPATKVTYADMDGNGAYYAALRLAEADVFTGERLGASYYFQPDKDITRGELLAMCMELCDVNVLTGVLSTGFSDDAQIAPWMKPYVSTALMDGIVTGYSVDGVAVFSSNSAVTFSEAAVMLNNVMDMNDVTYTGSLDLDVIPTWALQATANLSSCDMLPAGFGMQETMTRADAADMLLRAMDTLAAR